MFTQNSNTEIIEIKKERKIVGLNLQRSGFPITFDGLGQLWGFYNDDHKMRTKNKKSPRVEYGICLNRVPDYIVGCEVEEFEDVSEEFYTYVLPCGKYIKDSFNADTFENLLNEMGKRKVKKWAKENNIKIDGIITVEVYLKETDYPEMYVLYPIK